MEGINQTSLFLLLLFLLPVCVLKHHQHFDGKSWFPVEKEAFFRRQRISHWGDETKMLFQEAFLPWRRRFFWSRASRLVRHWQQQQRCRYHRQNTKQLSKGTEATTTKEVLLQQQTRNVVKRVLKRRMGEKSPLSKVGWHRSAVAFTHLRWKTKLTMSSTFLVAKT